jgi:tetratricopeptide (TPR) repeat protein
MISKRRAAMTTQYPQVDTELLAQMMRVAKQNPGTPAEHLEALQKAVEERKKQLLDTLANQPGNEAELAIYNQLITLEPENYTYYERAGFYARLIPDYPASAANYTSALQLVGDDIDKLAKLYEERSRTYCRYKDYVNALADSKLYVRFKYLSEKGKNYNFYMICESLRHLGHKALGDAIDTTYELAELSQEGVTDELIEDYCHLLEIPLDPRMAKTRSRPPLSRFNELKQQLPTAPQEVKKWQLRKQFYAEHEPKANPDYSLLHQIMQEFIRFEPTNYRYHATVGGLYFEQKDYQAAIPHLTKALALVDQYPGDSWWRNHLRKRDIFRLHRMLGWIYAKLRPYQTALKHYELAIRACPDHEDTTRLMGMFVQCSVRPGEGTRLRALEGYFRKAFPHEEVEDLVWMEELWADHSGLFVEFSQAGLEFRHAEHIHRQPEETPDSLTPTGEKTEEEQKREQKAAEALKHLEGLLYF